MPLLIPYLLKLSISLAVLYLFYQLLLRRLTFYNWNRWYLLGYSLLSFFIPVINIAGILNSQGLERKSMIWLVPSVEAMAPAALTPAALQREATFNQWDLLLLLLAAGSLLLLGRLMMQYLSFRRLRQKAELLSHDGVKLYQVSQPILPFSFGNAIFINQQQHKAEELQEIIRHEFVHVQQKHSIDVIWSELLCILNWYNPFVWLIRKAIRQNLEFIADNKVLQNGVDKKTYQYLLVNVLGHRQFSMATPFNFSSLKKRIYMMNKMKSTQVQLVKFLFVLPLIILLLVAFRSHQNTEGLAKANKPVFTDTVPVFIKEMELSKGNKEADEQYVQSLLIDKRVGNSAKPIWVIDGVPYAISANGSKAWFDENELKDSPEFKVWVDGKIVAMEEANANINRYNVHGVGAINREQAQKTYGVNYNLLLLNRVKQDGDWTNIDTVPKVSHAGKSGADLEKDYKAFLKRNQSVKHLDWTKTTIKITLVSGKVEIYSRDDKKSLAAAEAKYGPLPAAPPPPPIIYRADLKAPEKKKEG